LDLGSDSVTEVGPDRVTAVVLASASEVAGRPLDLDSDLLAAGFDSLAIVQLATVLTERLDVDCSFEDVFDIPSLVALATLLRGRLNGVVAP
jgi:acyl carrier protein